MKQLSKNEKERLLSRLYWDMNVAPDYLYHLLNDEITEGEEFDRMQLYRRLLTTYNWYILLKLVPTKRLSELLSDSVIKMLYPKDLRERFKYAREVLSK